jgi:hypothetical protein
VTDEELPEVIPHPKHPGLYEVGGWTFTDDPAEDADLEWVENSIRAYTAWRNFLKAREL